MSNLKPIHSSKNANFGMMAVVMGSVLAIVVGSFLVYIGLFLNGSIGNSMDSTLTPSAATGTITFSGNASHNDTINITNGNTGVKYSFAFKIGTANIPVAYAPIQMSAGNNGSTLCMQNLTAAISGNASVSAFLTASNGSSNDTRLAYRSVGPAGNYISIETTGANIAVSGLSGGIEGSTAWAASKSNVMTGYLVLGIMFIIIGAAGCITALMSLVGSVGGGGRR